LDRGGKRKGRERFSPKPRTIVKIRGKEKGKLKYVGMNCMGGGDRRGKEEKSGEKGRTWGFLHVWNQL